MIMIIKYFQSFKILATNYHFEKFSPHFPRKLPKLRDLQMKENLAYVNIQPFLENLITDQSIFKPAFFIHRLL